ncbi:MAG: response regulator [Pseudomonadota bacterium]|nr:response regulator [Pseudomonadota bacterium]
MADTKPVILNVDDNDGARYAKSRTLGRAGFTVLEAGTGAEALEAARKNSPDLVLLDVKLPDIDGLEVCRQLKEDTATRSIMVLQISASYLATADKIQALDGGADNYLFEPIEPEELIANVKALLRLGRVERSLREADSRKDVFLATLGHELRNPLGPIRNSVAVLQKLVSEGSEGQKKAVDIILRQTNHMVRLVDDLLDVARITQGKITLRKELVELKQIIDTAIETATPMVAARQHTLTVELPAVATFVVADPIRIAQVVANLLHNAAKFTPLGGTILIRATVLADSASISVVDNGIGIAGDSLGSIFELFAQAGHAADRVQDGLGIGLSLVRSLVELHGGTVVPVSAGLGLGSTFEVRLPLQSKVPAIASRASLPGEDKVTRRRVLVVDDDKDSARALGALLEFEGHEVEVCFNGADAIAGARRFRPETVFLDIGLPDMSGCEAAVRITELADAPDCTLIALTGYGQAQDADRIRAAGFHRHVVKPMDLSLLKELMQPRPTGSDRAPQ